MIRGQSRPLPPPLLFISRWTTIPCANCERSPESSRPRSDASATSPAKPTITDIIEGTGTGIWAIDFADAHPSASVIATDLSPIQPRNVPPNLQFLVDDFTAPWLYTKESFDFIHARSIYGCVADYPALYSEVYSALKPGGWFEQAEISVQSKSADGSVIGTNLEKFGQLAIEGGKKFGKSFSIAEDSEKLITEAGFVNVKCETFKWPIGTWPKERKMKTIGAYNRLGINEGLEGWAIFLFTKHLGVGFVQCKIRVYHFYLSLTAL
jgi:hypothetical protein